MLKEEIYNNKMIIDIRDSIKYNLGHIPGAVNIEKQDLLLNYDKYLSKSKEYIVYCEMGINSYKVASILKSRGYKVESLIGGYKNFIKKQ